MTNILPLLISNLSDQGISRVGAVINRQNIAAKKVLEKANFNFKARFDLMRDLYETATK